MADRIIADRALAHRSKTASEPSTTDTQLDSAVAVAGEHTERTQALAAELRIGSPSPLLMALQGEAFPPFDPSPEWYEDIPEGAFDGGLARVLAEEAALQHKRPAYLHQVQNSVMYARMVTVMVTALQSGAAAEELADCLTVDAARLFRAGWAMGFERAETDGYKRDAREKAQTTGTIDELVHLLTHRLHPGSASPDVWTSRGFWTGQQVEAALERVRAIEAPEEHAELMAEQIGGAR